MIRLVTAFFALALSPSLANAQGWPAIAPTAPTFSDVPPDHWAYGFIETLVAHHVVSGYADGTFRARDSVTRTVVQNVARLLQTAGCAVDILDFEREPLALYNPDTSHETPAYAALKALGISSRDIRDDVLKSAPAEA